MTLLKLIGEPLRVNGVKDGDAIKERVAELLRVAGSRPERVTRYPHAFSGGQRHRHRQILFTANVERTPAL